MCLLFCFVLFWILCCVVCEKMKIKKLLITKKKKKKKKGMCMQTFSPATSFRALHQASLLPEQILNNFVINSFPDVVIHHYIKRPTVS